MTDEPRDEFETEVCHCASCKAKNQPPARGLPGVGEMVDIVLSTGTVERRSVLTHQWGGFTDAVNGGIWYPEHEDPPLGQYGWRRVRVPKVGDRVKLRTEPNDPWSSLFKIEIIQAVSTEGDRRFLCSGWYPRRFCDRGITWDFADEPAKPADKPASETAQVRCGECNSIPLIGVRVFCIRNKGHVGSHSDGTISWPPAQSERERIAWGMAEAWTKIISGSEVVFAWCHLSEKGQEGYLAEVDYVLDQVAKPRDAEIERLTKSRDDWKDHHDRMERCAAVEVDRLKKELDNLRAWKESAMQFMSEWDRVGDEAFKGYHPDLGVSRAGEALKAIKRLRDEHHAARVDADRARKALAELEAADRAGKGHP